MKEVIRVKNGIKIFQERDTRKRISALRSIDLSVDTGELVSIIGPSGAGKTTLLRVISGIDELSSGELFIRDIPLHTLSSIQRKEFRKRYLGTFTQFGRQNFDPKMIVNEVLEWEAIQAGWSKADAAAKTNSLLKELNITHLKTQMAGKLSAGEAMRVSFLKAIVKEPYVILADEPTGQLDSTNMNELYQLMRELLNEQTAILVVTHDIRFQAISDRSLLILDGKLASQQERESLLQQRSTYFGDVEEHDVLNSQLFVDSNNSIQLPYNIMKRLHIGNMVEIEHEKGSDQAILRVLEKNQAEFKEDEAIKNFDRTNVSDEFNITVEHLDKAYIDDVKVLKDINVKIHKGEFVVILGPSGSGKTTLLNIIASLESITSGSVDVWHEDKTGKRKAMKTSDFSYLTQNYTGHPYLSIKDNALLPNIFSNTSIDKEEYEAFISRLELEEYQIRYPHELSGGQLQRASLLAALLKKSSILLGDEPTANLNTELAVIVMNLLIERAETGDTVVIATHDYTMVRPGFHVLRIENGTILEDIIADEQYCMKLQRQYLISNNNHNNAIK